MKIVKEHINEIKRSEGGSAFSSIGIGNIVVLKQWAKDKYSKNKISFGYTIDNSGSIHANWIAINMSDLKSLPMEPNIRSFKDVKRLICTNCIVNHNGDIVPKKDKSDFIKGATYNVKDNTVFSYNFVNHYLSYIALKFIASYGSEGVHDSKVKDKIKTLVFPNSDISKISYWDAVFQARYNTPVSMGTTRIAPRTYKLNYTGRHFIESHRSEFEK